MRPSPRAALWRKAGTPFPGITFPSFALLLSVLVWAPSGSSPFPQSLPLLPTSAKQFSLEAFSILPHGSRLGTDFSLPLPLQFFHEMCRH